MDGISSTVVMGAYMIKKKKKSEPWLNQTLR
jgi:hypothetical protein